MKPQKFLPNSRYYGIETRTWKLPDGRDITYLSRRFVPAPEKFATLAYQQIVRGDRPDNLAYHLIGDPEQYWKIADANTVLRPNELTEVPGHFIRVTLPEGVPSPEETEQ